MNAKNRVNPNQYVEKNRHSGGESTRPSVTAEWFYKEAGKLSTIYFAKKHPDAAQVYLADLLSKVGVEVRWDGDETK